ncbi:MAG TPA: LysR family transcriptional regulator [Gammaproteobacteria bacterium]|jgi:DNA-binding transcriptional LysR family regulator|nr:LysR family transcriptional regulator [Gammaproteobacteria bacterium]
MRDDPTSTLRSFLLIARHGSFTRAAAELDVTASALSQTLRQLEQHLGVRLLARTTRRVGLTEAGREFLARITPALSVLDDAMEGARQHGDRPAGTLRLTAAPVLMLQQVIPDFLNAYPDITLDIRTESRLVDLISEGFDAGIRLGERLEKDMVAVPLGGPMRSVVVGAPDYFAQHGTPKHPRELQAHNCVRYRFSSDGATYRWEFAERGRWFEIGVGGNLIVNDNALMLATARAGVALAHLPESLAADDIAAGRLRSVLDTWLPPYDGWYLYYPSRFQVPPKLRVFIDFLRTRLG